jgi:hypothetical protein
MASIYFWLVLVEEFIHKTIFYAFPKKYDLKVAMETLAGFAMHGFLQRPNSKPIPYEDIDEVMMGISICYFMGWQIFGTIKALIYVFTTFMSIFLIDVFRKANDIMRNLPKHHQQKVSRESN